MNSILENWRASSISSDLKSAQFSELRRIYSMPASVVTLNAIDELHNQFQSSVRLHFCSHLLYSRVYLTTGRPVDGLSNLWLAVMAPFASVSIRLGLDRNRRFFGLGPIRDVGRNQP